MKKIKIASLLLLTTLLANGCAKNTIDDKNIVVGASSTPHAEILKQAEKYIKEKGYTLKIVEFDDYVMPNKGVMDESLDANYFQHLPYLEDYNKQNKTDIVSVGKIHIEPLGIYSKNDTLTNIKQNAKVAIPNDNTNGGRALRLLESLNLIEIDSSKTGLVNINDITANPYKLEIVTFEAKILSSQLDEFNYLVINSNYALSSNVDKYLLPNSSEDTSPEGLAGTYANIIACKKGNENSKAIKILLEALRQENIKEYIDATYKGAVIYYEG